MLVDPRVFRTYDIRALVPHLVDSDSTYFGKLEDPAAYNAPLSAAGVERIGRGLSALFNKPLVAIGRDSRLSGPEWAVALSEGFNAQGVDVIDLGLTTTDMIYYVSGKRGIPAVQITASHCTREFNGMKIVRDGARIVGSGSGMEELRDLVMEGRFPGASGTGGTTKEDILPEYLNHLMGFLPHRSGGALHVIADAGSGVAGVVAGPLAEKIAGLRLEPMFFQPDGEFPGHDPNPFETENIRDLMNRVPAESADFGVAWDGDADRVFFVDDGGTFIPGDFITTLVARYFLERFPGEPIVFDVRSSRVVRHWVERLGGRPIAERVGHSFMKQTMRRENAIFGGEVSGHYYFRHHYFADNGFIPFLAVISMLRESGGSLKDLIAGLGDYYVTGEINSTVDNVHSVLQRIESRYDDADLSYLDGISVDYPEWRFNVRPSANDPVIRLNLEAAGPDMLAEKRDEVLALIRQSSPVAQDANSK